MLILSKNSIFRSKFLILSLFSFFCILPVSSQTDQSLLLDSASIQSVAQMVSDSFGAPVDLVAEFIREAKKMEIDEGVAATAFIGIAILESTGFTSYLYQNAKNPFGMRATKIWKGPTFVMWHEGTDSHFRKYENPRGAVRDFAAFLNSRKWFRDALACPTSDLECFLTAMSADPLKKEPGYAADPEWANKVRRVIKKYELDRIR
ncbi:MAG: glucosaminidase domain-containing protein [Saprospiraceae bacterium]